MQLCRIPNVPAPVRRSVEMSTLYAPGPSPFQESRFANVEKLRVLSPMVKRGGCFDRYPRDLSGSYAHGGGASLFGACPFFRNVIDSFGALAKFKFGMFCRE